MAHPYLMFCPYLNIEKVLPCGPWALGPLEAFDGRWADARFETQAKAFLQKFVGPGGEPIRSPTIVAPRQAPIDGAFPGSAEIAALDNAIGFSFVDGNPRNRPGQQNQSWNVLTADNAELFVWPIDVTHGYVTVSTGLMVRTLDGGYQISDPSLLIRPPLDLRLSNANAADTELLEAVYDVVLGSAANPGANLTADRLHVAIRWLLKAWRNTATVHWAERIVFLKTAFEAITGTEKSHISAQRLRDLFKTLSNVLSGDVDGVIWSPSETPSKTRTWIDRGGTTHIDQVTDLEHWFMAFAEARNAIIHQGIVPSLNYVEPGSNYEGHYVFTAEFLLRAVIKVSMESLGHADLWRSDTSRAVIAAAKQLQGQAPPRKP